MITSRSMVFDYFGVPAEIFGLTPLFQEIILRFKVDYFPQNSIQRLLARDF